MFETPLAAAHQRMGARWATFSGWSLPLSFSGVREEHRAVREAVGVFDLCHMARLRVQGSDAVRLLEVVSPSPIRDMRPGTCRYTVFLNAQGGIVDDVIITCVSGTEYHICANAGSRETVVAYLFHHVRALSAQVVDESEATAQIAIQGPAAAPLVRDFLDGGFPAYMTAAGGHFQGAPLSLTRTGYTGELGVEILLPVEQAAALWDHVTARAVACGLGARDTLRLEMGYPLYGHELGVDVSPVAAGLSWLVDWKRPDFLGHATLLAERTAARRKLTGLVVEGSGIPRQGCPVMDGDSLVGEVTSGNMSLSLNQGVALAFVDAKHAGAGTGLTVEVRGRRLPVRVTPPPFYRAGSLKTKVT
ncbi:MAG: glycine cleavage system aminomethyltransferase GcvT [Leptospirillia bacterium]